MSLKFHLQIQRCLCCQVAGLGAEAASSRILSSSLRLWTLWSRYTLWLFWCFQTLCLAGYGCCGQARPVGVLLLLACQRLCKCPWNGRYLSWGDEDGSLSGEFKIVKHLKLRIVMLGQDCWHRRPVFCQGQRSFGGISGSLHMLAFYLQRLQVSCALSQGKRNILKNPDPGLRQTLVKIYNKVKELK